MYLYVFSAVLLFSLKDVFVSFYGKCVVSRNIIAELTWAARTHVFAVECIFDVEDYQGLMLGVCFEGEEEQTCKALGVILRRRETRIQIQIDVREEEKT
jgi:hypothetical protein